MFCKKISKPIQRKVVVVGDGACGKTSALNVFSRGFFPQVYYGAMIAIFILLLFY
jgi:Rho family protein